MRAVIQRTAAAEVSVEGESIGSISAGLLVYVGVSITDTVKDARMLANKVANLRIFEDADGKLNLSVLQNTGEVLAIPNFTLQADARKGRRPSFTNAARGEAAKSLFDEFVDALKHEGCRVETGQFGADMTINAAARGPVNIVVDMPPLP